MLQVSTVQGLPSSQSELWVQQPLTGTNPQIPLAQAASLQVAEGQTFPQLPQFLASDPVLTQAPPQQVPVPPPESVHVPPGFG